MVAQAQRLSVQTHAELVALTVEAIADDRPALGGEVNPDLMRATGADVNFH